MTQQQTTPLTSFQKEGVISTEYLWKKLITLLNANGNHVVKQSVTDLYHQLCADSSWLNYCSVMTALNHLRHQVTNAEEKSLSHELILAELIDKPAAIDTQIQHLPALAEDYTTREEFRFKSFWRVSDDEFPLWRHWTQRVFDALDTVTAVDGAHWEHMQETFFANCGSRDFIFLSQNFEHDHLVEAPIVEVHQKLRMQELHRQTSFSEMRDRISKEIYGSDNMWTVSQIEKLFLFYLKRFVSEESRRAEAPVKMKFIIGLFPRLNRKLLDAIYDSAVNTSPTFQRRRMTSPCESTISRHLEMFHVHAQHILEQAGQLIPEEENIADDVGTKPQPQQQAAPVSKPMPPFMKWRLIAAFVGIVLLLALIGLAFILLATCGPVGIFIAAGLLSAALVLSLAANVIIGVSRRMADKENAKLTMGDRVNLSTAVAMQTFRETPGHDTGATSENAVAHESSEEDARLAQPPHLGEELAPLLGQQDQATARALGL